MQIKKEKILFCVSLFILGLSVGLLIDSSRSNFSLPSVFGQQVKPISAGGIIAFTGQISKDTYGIMMIDVDAGTLWIYQYQKPGNQLKLLAARSWIYDRYLEDYNSASPTPAEVSQLISNIQQKKQQTEILESQTEK